MSSFFNIYADIKSKGYILGVFIIIYFLVSLLGIYNHEIWLDEGHHWLLARDSNSLTELLYNTRYEGHPRLWNIMLYIISRFTHNVFWMQFVHIIISTITVGIFLYKSPFSLLFKILSVFGYLFIFEYNIISRNYILGVLFLFLALSIYNKRKSKYVLFCAFLALASNVHFIFLVITPVLLIPDVIQFVKQKQWAANKMLIGFLVFTFGVVLSIIQIIPPSDSVFFDSINEMPLINKVGRSFLTFYKGIFLIPDFTTTQFWNTNILFNLSIIASIAFGFLSFLTPLFIFHKNKHVLLYVYISIAIGLLFFFLTQRVNARSELIYYLIFITALWIEKFHKENPLRISNHLINKKLLLVKHVLIYTIVFCHFFSGITSYIYDFIYPFTNTKQVVEFIKENNYQSLDIITPFCDAPISSYTEKYIYSLCQQEMTGYCDWNLACKTDVLNSNENLLLAISEHLKDTKKNQLFITLKPFNEDKITGNNWYYLKNFNFRYRLLTNFNRGIVSKSNYSVYEVDYYSQYK